MKVMSYNTRFGGFEGGSNARYLKIIEVIRSIKPDVLLIQEAKDFHLNGYGRMFAMERDIDMRGFLGFSPHTGQHTAVFTGKGYQPVTFDQDSAHFHHASAILSVNAPEFPKPLTFISAHLCPFGGKVRLSEACYLASFADAEQFVLVGGDFNSVAPDDPEPAWDTLPLHFKARYVEPETGKGDRKTLQALYQAGFVDVAGIFDKTHQNTVPTASFTQVEFVPFRSDYLLVTPALAKYAKSYEVVKTGATDLASDHYPILAEFQG